MQSLALSSAQQRRLEKLARLAGRTPQSMLRFVLRDGFDATERDVKETVEADKDADQNGTIPHDAVMEQARTIIERHAAKRPRKAA
jgi:predicted transcriptional regulator